MTESAAAPAPVYSKGNPFPATLVENRLLTKNGSQKETRHFVIGLQGSGLRCEPGSSIGIFPHNPPSLVGETLEAFHFDPATPIPQPGGSSQPLGQLLLSTYTLNRALGKFLKTVAEKLPAGAAKDQLHALIADPHRCEEYLYTRDYVDIAREFPAVHFTPAEFLDAIGKINPRLYSIASSPDRHPNQVHLTVAIIRYQTHGRPKKGLTSGCLADDTPLHTPALPVFLVPSKHFHLPHDPAAPIIMIGPGTGIAPFRAFLEHRQFHGHTGKNWLFFGDQRRNCDFLYEEELTAWHHDGLLTRLDTAFSRDQEHKLYVQDRMRENGRELWDWIRDGAYVYVCGNAKRMAKDVHQSLVDIAAHHGGLSADDAETFFSKTLHREEKRYMRDVY